MTEDCPECGATLRWDAHTCISCGAVPAPPNVRFAERAIEAAALSLSWARALELASSNKATAEVERLDHLAKHSKMVINRKLRALSEWINSDDELYVNFYKLRERGLEYEDNVYNRQRVSAENTISPNFFDQLVVGALTIDGRGMTYYGEYTILIRQDRIASRASVFWENPFIFNKNHSIISGEDPPVGYRAPWGERNKIVVAKLAGDVKPGDGDAALAALVMGPDRAAKDCDFVEVHVHKHIHANEIEAVIAPSEIPADDEDAWEFLRDKLATKSIKC
ncbi:zinc ribbon domain-containing protein [Methylobacterium sp. NMS14P]|uniref:zinc ribbon domain-containing protein n=1 Tax=Methylobacterium sp. NMS14P TaxID=2894310 RepID=UPI002358C9FA|nr:zinc ribbon domain-containing protein [Methylobacterium sp. NMS14P]WCS23890.1 zinc ribbon domain-containing protein [Methylobacterium sp. NMS14P]